MFVLGKSTRDWWNHGISEHALYAYGILVQSNIPEQMGIFQVRTWQMNIFDMLKCIPSTVMN